MSFYRHLLLRTLRCSATALKPHPAIYASSRTLAFSSAEEAAAERRRRKRRLRIEPPLHALRRDPDSPRPPRDPNAPRLPDSTSALVGPRLSLHNKVQSLIRAGDLDAASAAARHAVFSSTRPTVFTCNAIIAAMFRARRLDDAVALFHYFFDQCTIVPNVVSYNFLINAHSDAGRVDKALEFYHRILNSAPFSPSPVTYRHLSKGLVEASRINEAMDLLREMLNRGHGADSLVFNNLMAGFIDLGNMDRALELFEELRERCLVYDGVVHATLMEGYFERGMDEEAMDSYHSLLAREFKMNSVTCNTLLGVLLKHMKIKEANALFDHMLSAHNPPSFLAMDSNSYNLMVNKCFERGDFAGSVEVFHRKGTKPCVVDVGCFNNIIGKLCGNGLLPEAEKLFEEMPEKSVNPDVTTYGLLIDACFREGRRDDSLKYFNKMVNACEAPPKVDVSFYNKMFDGLVKAGRVGDAAEIFENMRGKGVKPESRSYETLVTGLCKEGNLDRCRDFLEEMDKSGVSASPELCEIVLEGFGKGRGEEVARFFTEKIGDVAPHSGQVLVNGY